MLSVNDELLTYVYTNVCSYHWILFIIEVDRGLVQIMDPLDRDMEQYRDMQDMLQK